MLQWGLLILKNQNPTLSLVYGVFTVIETPEVFLPYGFCFCQYFLDSSTALGYLPVSLSVREE